MHWLDQTKKVYFLKGDKIMERCTTVLSYIKEGIRIVTERCKEENQTEHAAAVYHAKGYQGDIEWEHNGKKCS